MGYCKMSVELAKMPDLMGIIFSHLPEEDLAAPLKVCKAWRSQINKDFLMPPPANAFDAAAWEKHYPIKIGKHPLYSKRIHEKLFKQPCQVTLVALIPGEITLEGSSVKTSFCLDILDAIAQKPKEGNATFLRMSDAVKAQHGQTPVKAQWVSIKVDVARGTRGHPYAVSNDPAIVPQQTQVEQLGYQPVEIIHSAAVIAEYVRTGQFLLRDVYTRTQQTIQFGNNTYRVCFGYFSPGGGLSVDSPCASAYYYVLIGLAGARSS